MTRTPLRPLARILTARAKGENPDMIERENLRLRHEAMRDTSRLRSESRLLVLGVFFFVAFTMVGARMGLLAASEPEEPSVADSGTVIDAERADIVDRNGRILATNLLTSALYAQPPLMVDPARCAAELAKIFPDLDADWLTKHFLHGGLHGQIHRQLQRFAIVGRIAQETVKGFLDPRRADHFRGMDAFTAKGGKPLQLAMDLTVQAAVQEVLAGGMKLMSAKGATAVLMDVHTGEVISLVSLPDFDPNTRPANPVTGDASDSPLFNRAVQGVYELGSTFKIFTVAEAIELGLVNVNTLIKTASPMTWGKFKIRDFHNYGDQLSVAQIIIQSSNIGTARIALQIGADRQKSFLKSLGLFEATPVELVEAPGAKPIVPKRWPEITTMTVSYGHGLSASPMHLAAGYASIVNGGTLVRPTLLKQTEPQHGARIISEKTSAIMRTLMREVVTEGTASFAEVPGYEVGGKTGSADKTKPTGGYYKDKVVATFAAAFPMSAPKYVLVVTLDEAVDTSTGEARRTAGWTAVPVAAEMIRRIAPLLGMRPAVETAAVDTVSLVNE